MKKTLVLLLSLSILFWITTASNCWTSWKCLTSSSTQEVTQAKKALWNKASIFESLIPLFKAKDKETQDAVRALLVIFKSSRDPYTRNIGIYFEYLIEIAYWAEDSDSNSSDSNSEDSNSNNNNDQEENNTPVSNWTISIASTSSNSTVIREGTNAELISFSVTVKDRSYNLKNLEAYFWGNTNGISSTTLEIDWSAVETARISSNKISFNNLDESLTIWKHTFTLKANVSSGKFTVEKVTIGKWNDALSKSLGITKLVAKAYPILSSRISWDDLVITIKNPSDSYEDVRLLGFAIKWWSISSASINDKNIDLKQWVNKSISNMWIELAAWDSTELRLQAAKGTIQVNAIKISVDWNTYVITNNYSNIGKWSSFKITPSRDYNWMPINTYVNSSETDIIGVDYQSESTTDEEDNNDNNQPSDNKPTSEITIATQSASSTVILDGSNTELATFTATVKNGSYDLNKVTIELWDGVPSLANQSITLQIDGQSVASTNYDGSSSIIISNLNETLAVGKHQFVVNANANIDNNWRVLVEIKSAKLNNDVTKTLSIKKLITKAYPVIRASVSSDELILKIENPKDNNEDFEIVGFDVSGKVVTAAFDDNEIKDVVNTNKEIAARELSLADWDSTELRLQAARSETIQVTAIIIKVDWKMIKISNDYTNVGKWSSFKVTAWDNGSKNWYYIENLSL